MRGIVVGVERSREGLAAVEWALREAVLRDQPLRALRVWTGTDGLGPAHMSGSPEDAAVRLAAEVVKEATERVPGADLVEVQVTAVRGMPGTALAAAAKRQPLLVVGTRSAGALSRVLLGSVSMHVLHHAACPVAVVPAPRDESGKRGEARSAQRPRVVVGVDHSEVSWAALRWAAEEAHRRSAVLVPVAVRRIPWASDPARERSHLSLAELEANERRLLTEHVPPHRGLAVEPDVLAGHAGRALVDFVSPDDLVVLGTRGRSGPARVLGSTSTYVAEHAPCPVVVVRGSDAPGTTSQT